MRLMVSGSRTIGDPATVAAALDRAQDTFDLPRDTVLVHGNAKGVDRLAASLALLRGWPVEAHPADWETLGRRAGIVRNNEMLDTSDCVLAVWDGRSKGTLHAINQAIRRRLPLLVCAVTPTGTMKFTSVVRQVV